MMTNILPNGIPFHKISVYVLTVSIRCRSPMMTNILPNGIPFHENVRLWTNSFNTRRGLMMTPTGSKHVA
jgi:hypothetical protein